MKKVLNDLFDYGLKIYQYEDAFKFSLDSILLAEFVKIAKKTQEILDLCTGNASIPLILSTKTKAHIDAFEIQFQIYNLARENIIYNNLDKQITIYNDDIKNVNKYLPNKKYDIITCNPPFFKVDNKTFINNLYELAIARHEVMITLDEIFKIASSHLNTKGEFYLVHRVNRLDEIINLGIKYNLPVKNIILIKTRDNNLPTIILLRCIKDSKMGIKINDIVSVENRTTYKEIFKEAL